MAYRKYSKDYVAVEAAARDASKSLWRGKFVPLCNAVRVWARESAVVVRADKVTSLEKFVAVVDEIRGLGFQQVSLEVIRL